MIVDNWEKLHGVKVITGKGKCIVYEAVKERVQSLIGHYVQDFKESSDQGSLVVYLCRRERGELLSVLAYIPPVKGFSFVGALPMIKCLCLSAWSCKHLHPIDALHMLPTSMATHSLLTTSACSPFSGAHTSHMNMFLPTSAHHDCTFLSFSFLVQ